ncbi:hypothetical protein [Halogeometricum luteum]|uniref:Uncharacterized protein n=1 Tax=Halogeometricum luteum TaxID=2950537 RepID=A0ABU2G1X5_9EURY|nr:hypothetical protein [Halogeometricum sp. S3BR5-2]MDS0294782.1 hypothetical protein [Halogeometricum sp. S3BR5-2]
MDVPPTNPNAFGTVLPDAQSIAREQPQQSAEQHEIERMQPQQIPQMQQPQELSQPQIQSHEQQTQPQQPQQQMQPQQQPQQQIQPQQQPQQQMQPQQQPQQQQPSQQQPQMQSQQQSPQQQQQFPQAQSQQQSGQQTAPPDPMQFEQSGQQLSQGLNIEGVSPPGFDAASMGTQSSAIEAGAELEAEAQATYTALTGYVAGNDTVYRWHGAWHPGYTVHYSARPTTNGRYIRGSVYYTYKDGDGNLWYLVQIQNLSSSASYYDVRASYEYS